MRTSPPDNALRSEQGVAVNLRSVGYAVDDVSQRATYFWVNDTRTHACTRVGSPALRFAARLQGGLRDKRSISRAHVVPYQRRARALALFLAHALATKAHRTRHTGTQALTRSS